MPDTDGTKRGERIRTGIAGEFYVAAELSRRGWIATLTAKNTPDYDVLAARPAGDTQARIDVKTRTPAYGRAWRVGNIRMSGERDFIVLVYLGEDYASPRHWIVPARQAQELIVHEQIRVKDVGEFEDRWDLLDS
jgi:hypothetical protein